MTAPQLRASGGRRPGDPGLLTVAGRDALRAAEVVVYDASARGR